MTPINVDGNILMMKAFPFSLAEKAKDWLYELAPGMVTYWESMKGAFLEKFFPTLRVILLRKKISGIQQSQGESFPAYYKRFKALVASCPQHQMKEELLLQYFYEGLLPIERQMLDASAGGHPNDQCPQLIENGGWESANVVGFGSQNQPRNDPYSNTYNPGWRDHPNFKWREPQQPAQQGGFRQTPPGVFQRPYAPPQVPQQSAQINSGSSLDNDTLLQLLNSLTQGQQNQAKEISEVNRQIGQISEFIGQFREEGKLPSSTIVNPKGGFETAKAITLRSGKEVGTDSQLSKPAQTEDKKLQQEEDVQNTPTARKETTLPCTPTLPKPSNSTKVSPNSKFSSSIPLNAHFPSRFMQSKNEEDEKDILETFRKVHVNIPLLDAIKQIPKYSKFLNKLCTTRKWIREKEVVHVSENVFALLQRKLPPKCKDPDFYVLEMEDSAHSPSSPLLLGRPFMKTAQTKIDVAKGAVTMAFGGDMINFNVSDYVEKPNHVRSCFAVDVVKNIGQEPSTRIKKDAFQTTNEEGIGVDDKECTTIILKTPNLAENTPHAFVDCVAISLQHIGKLPIPISIPISTNRLLPCMVQVPNRIQADGNDYIDFRMLNTPIKKDYYPLPFIEPMYEYFEEHAVENIPLHAMSPIQT
ncbi:unnamed protein product [Malus baccata var. baccata]